MKNIIRMVGIFIMSVFFLSPVVSQNKDIKNYITEKTEEIAENIISIRRDIHAHPELPNREFRTAKLVAEHLRKLGIEVTENIAHTGVCGILKGNNSRKIVAARADMDALPIDEKIDAPYISLNPGVKHACGHDAHTAILLGVAEVLSSMKDRLPGTVKFIFQPAEEGAPDGEEGGADLMIKEGILEDPSPSAIFGLHVSSGDNTGTISYKEKGVLASSDIFEIIVKGQKSHGAYPHQGKDAIVIGAQIVNVLQTIVSRQLNINNAGVVTVGIFEGGNRFNIIADRVRMVGTVRTHDDNVRKSMPERIEKIVKGITDAFDADYTLNYNFGVPVTYNDPELTGFCVPYMEEMIGKENLLISEPHMGAEDFAYYAREIPGFFFFLGTRNEEKGIVHMGHTAEHDIDEGAIPVGIKVMSYLLYQYLKNN